MKLWIPIVFSLGACGSGFDEGEATVGEGDLYPAVSVSDCDGNPVDVRAYLAQHEASYVTFGAQWCTACQEEAPVINRELVDGLAAEEVGVVQILVENQPDQPPPQALCAAWRDDLSARFTVWVDTRQEHLEPFFAGAVGTLPLHLVVTQDGVIRMKKLGAIPEDIKAIVEGWLPLMTQATKTPKDQAVLILGCGFLGQVVAQRLAFKGVPVVGTTRTHAQVGVIRTRGAEPILFDGDDLTALARVAPRVRSIVMSIPPGEGLALDRRLVELFAAHPITSAVYVSSTSVYGDRAGAVTVEGDPVAPDGPKGRLRVEAEDVWRAAPFPTAVLRPAGIYGPGRSLLHRLASGKYRLVGGGLAVTNRVHVADLASLVVRALERPRAGATWLGSDLVPTPQAEVVRWIGELTGWPAPPEMSLAEARVRLDKDTLGMFVQSKRLDSSATLAELGVTLKYPSYREGLGDVWLKERTALEGQRQKVDAPSSLG